MNDIVIYRVKFGNETKDFQTLIEAQYYRDGYYTSLGCPSIVQIIMKVVSYKTVSEDFKKDEIPKKEVEWKSFGFDSLKRPRDDIQSEFENPPSDIDSKKPKSQESNDFKSEWRGIKTNSPVTPVTTSKPPATPIKIVVPGFGIKK